jgi:hypothetical protein
VRLYHAVFSPPVFGAGSKTDNQAPCIFVGSIENKDGFLAYTPGAEVSIDMSLVVSSTTPAASGTALSTPAVALAAAPWSI